MIKLTTNPRRRRSPEPAGRAFSFRSYVHHDDATPNRSQRRLPSPPPPPGAVQELRRRSHWSDEREEERPFDPEERMDFGTKPHHFAYPNPGRRVTRADWIAATSGNATADREEFEDWALSQPGAPRRTDPSVWGYLMRKLEQETRSQVHRNPRPPARARELPPMRPLASGGGGHPMLPAPAGRMEPNPIFRSQNLLEFNNRADVEYEFIREVRRLSEDMEEHGHREMARSLESLVARGVPRGMAVEHALVLLSQIMNTPEFSQVIRKTARYAGNLLTELEPDLAENLFEDKYAR